MIVLFFENSNYLQIITWIIKEARIFSPLCERKDRCISQSLLPLANNSIQVFHKLANIFSSYIICKFVWYYFILTCLNEALNGNNSRICEVLLIYIVYSVHILFFQTLQISEELQNSHYFRGSMPLLFVLFGCVQIVDNFLLAIMMHQHHPCHLADVDHVRIFRPFYTTWLNDWNY